MGPRPIAAGAADSHHHLLMVSPSTSDGNAAAQAQQIAAAAGLVHVSDTAPGFARIRRGMRFVYWSADASPVLDAATLARIARLAIPPAYVDVWICADPRGHLQATGRDARRRKQYRYHPDWRVVRDDVKFGRMIAFGEALPCLRRRLRADLKSPGLSRDKVLATVVTLLDVTRARIGNESYVRDNGSYGLTTLRNRHVTFVRDGRLRLVFRGKGGTDHDVTVDDRRLTAIVRHCQQLPGQLLFQYLDDDGVRRPVTSDLVNDYLQRVMGAPFTAKDFRTWSATLRAFALMAHTPLPEPPSVRACKACEVAAIKAVAAELRNTPAVCRKSYINPAVFAAWRSGALHEGLDGDVRRAPRRAEVQVLQFLRADARTALPRSARAPAPRRTSSPRGERLRVASAAP